ncbi:MAG TPA: polyprenyl synthetase family protein [Bdellovibrionales bacterium]|nr:polyprenyl synthetase family protein [Bdellovibrionales bacterium]
MKKLKIYDSRDFPAYLPKLNSLFDDLFADGKGFRSALVQKVSSHLALSERPVHLLCQTIEFIHNASLLHDDLIDRSHLRRNKPAAWVKYTPEYAVLAGDYLLARVMVNLSSHGNVQLIQYTAQVISDLLEGEWIQDSLVRDFAITLEQLDRVHNLKTGSLFKWCLRAPFIGAEIYREDVHALLEEAGTILGLLFQRSDDLLDFDVRNYENKAVLGDLKSGYLNSFGVFITRELPADQRERALKSQSLGEFKAALGEKFFDERVAEFDRINTTLIELYDHQLDRLSSLLSDSQRGLIDELRPLSKPIYWRKK